MRLLFVYNANSGLGNSLIDIAHKAVAPNTYSCSLCQLTHGVLLERKIWKRFRQSLNTIHPKCSLEFLHKDVFLKEYASKWLPNYEFPIVLKADNADFKVWYTASQINQMSSPVEFVDSLYLKLEEDEKRYYNSRS